MSPQTLALGSVSLLIPSWIRRPGPLKDLQWLEDGLQHSHPHIHLRGTKMFRSRVQEIGIPNLCETRRMEIKRENAGKMPATLKFHFDLTVDHYRDSNCMRSQPLDLKRPFLSPCMLHVSRSCGSAGWALLLLLASERVPRRPSFSL